MIQITRGNERPRTAYLVAASTRHEAAKGPFWKMVKNMTNLNNDIRELETNELDAVSGGTI